VAALGLAAGRGAVGALEAQGLVITGPQRLAATRAGRAVLDGVVRALVAGE